MSTTKERTAPNRTPRQRHRIFPVTQLRLERMQHGLRLYDVATRAGMSLTRASYVERDPASATTEELDALKAAIAELASPESGEAA